MGSWRGRRSIAKFFSRKRRKHKKYILPDAAAGERVHRPGEISGTGTLSEEHRREIISLYGRALEKFTSPVERELDLPFEKDLIRRAICEELKENPEVDLRSHLEIAYAQLESFLPESEYRVVEEFKLAGVLAQEMAESGKPRDIVASARILKELKGDRALEITEQISVKMRERLEQIQSFRMSCPE